MSVLAAYRLHNDRAIDLVERFVASQCRRRDGATVRHAALCDRMDIFAGLPTADLLDINRFTSILKRMGFTSHTDHEDFRVWDDLELKPFNTSRDDVVTFARLWGAFDLVNLLANELSIARIHVADDLEIMVDCAVTDLDDDDRPDMVTLDATHLVDVARVEMQLCRIDAALAAAAALTLERNDVATVD